jgi:hypothetical protein
MFRILLIIAIFKGSSCFGELNQPDPAIAGMSFKELKRKAIFLYLTSPGRELKIYSDVWYVADLALRRLEVYQAVVEDTGPEITKYFQEQIHSQQRDVHAYQEEKEKASIWFRRNCGPGTALYFYQNGPKNDITCGYCVFKNGRVISSYICTEHDDQQGRSENPSGKE